MIELLVELRVVRKHLDQAQHALDIAKCDYDYWTNKVEELKTKLRTVNDQIAREGR